MADNALDSRAEVESLRRVHESLLQHFRLTLSESARVRREVSAISMIAAWAMRVSPAGWAVFREGRIIFTNRSFDALDRPSLIGPRWIPCSAGADGAAGTTPEDGGRTLREVVADEARLLTSHPRVTRRQGRFCRGDTVVEVLVERPVAPMDENSALIFIRDLSDLVKARKDVSAMEARMIETERAGVAAELAMGVAHDLGNLVAALRARLVGLPDDPSCRLVTQALETIVDAQAALVSRLQAVAHPRETALRSLSVLADVVQPAVRLIESSLANGGADGHSRIAVEIDPSLSADVLVTGPSDELINMMINLLLNARDAMPRGGIIRISAHHLFGGVQLRIEDEGAGIPTANLQRIFQPLFSTKAGSGMGMGLATAAALMRRLGGSIVARNRPQGGACLELTFVDAVAAEEATG